MKICSNCGKQIKEDSVFCTFCGAPADGKDSDRQGKEPVTKGKSAGKGEEKGEPVKGFGYGWNAASSPSSPVRTKSSFPKEFTLNAKIRKPEVVLRNSPRHPVAVLFAILAVGYLALEVWHLAATGMRDPIEILNYLFLNALIPLGLFAVGQIIQLLSDIRYYTKVRCTVEQESDMDGLIKVKRGSE